LNLALFGETVHTLSVRANINLDADAYSFAYAYARGKGIPLGAAVSELLRQREQMPQPPMPVDPRLRINELGLLVVAKTGRTITPEMVKEFSEDDLD
jgi:hypothetical protein